MAHLQAFSVAWYISYVTALMLLHSPSSKATGFSLKLIPLFSQESPLYPGNLTQFERIHKIFEISKARANYLASMSKPDAFLNPEDIYLRVHEKNYFYTVDVLFGTPSKSEFLLFDTGSYLIWTQCLPCVNCFNQSAPIFNPNASSTYKRIPCDDPICRRPPFRCENGQCVHRINYAGGASASGLVSTETFTFPLKNKLVCVPGVIFGCSNDNRDFSFDGNIAGILGFSVSPFSLLGQLKSTAQGLFSYCLVYAYREMEATSILRFGKDANIQRKDMKTIRMFVDRSSHYYLSLQDISVADHRIGFAPGTFALRRNGTGGCMIDTGAIATFIQRGPYEVVMRHFDEHFTSFGRQRMHNASEDWEYCYRYDSRFRAYASMTFHFDRADFKVEPTYMYFIFQNEGYFCVAISFSDRNSVVGAWQQQDTRFVYDLNTGTIRFAPENCANDHFL